MARRTWWKVGALLAAMMMFLTMLPTVALAADMNTVYVGGVALTGSSDSTVYATTNENGEVIRESATADNYNIMWDGSTLTLKNAYITNAAHGDSYLHPVEGAAIGVANSSGDAELTIQLESGNTIEDVSPGIWVYSSATGYASLTITGDGNLTASGSVNPGILVQSNDGNATLSIENAEVTTTSSSSCGVQVRAKDSSNASLTVNGGSLTATGKSEHGAGIQYTFGGSSSGSGKPSLTVSGNAIVRANGSAGGITSNSSTEVCTAAGTGGSGGIVWNGKNGTVYGDVTLQEDLTIGEGESLDIPSGASLTIDDGATLNNEGTVTNSGTLTNNGTINNSGTLPDIINGNGTVNHAPTITTPSLPDGTVGTAYSQALSADGTEPITWDVSSDSLPAGLSVNEDTGVVSGTPTAAGTSIFTVTASNVCGSDSKQLSITINKPANVPVTGVTLSRTELSLLENQTATLTATVQPTDATNKAVTWTSSDPDVATVDATGNVTAVGAGTATITVTTADGGKTASCTVAVAAKTFGISAFPTSLDFGGVYTGYAQPAAQTVTVTNTGNQSVTLTQPTSTNFEIGALSATALAPNDTATFSVRPKPGLSAGTYRETLAITGTGGASCTVDLSFSVRTPYIPPRPTGPDWGDVADDIADAEPGSTVKVDMDGKTVLPGEVLDELAGRDVTLALDMGDGLFWEICGGDVPADAEYDDVDLGVALGGDDIPADVANLVTGESGSVQVSLEHDGLFGFELMLVAPLGEDAAGLVANLYCYDDEAGSLGYEATAQVDGEGVARLPFDHASSWLVALDSRSHALPFPDALEGEWYSEAVRWAWLSGLMTGYGDGPSAGLFGTGDVLTRAQLAAVLYNAAGQPEVDPAGAGAFVDCDPAAWYAEAVAWAASQGLMTGYGDGSGRFGPDDGLTREQLAAVFWRAAGEPAADADLSAFPDGGEASAWALESVEWAVETGLLKGSDATGELGPADPLERAQLAAVLMRVAQAAA